MNELEIAQRRAECLKQIKELQERRDQLVFEFESCAECRNRSIYTACQKHNHVGGDIDKIDAQIIEIDGSMPVAKEDLVQLSDFIHEKLH